MALYYYLLYYLLDPNTLYKQIVHEDAILNGAKFYSLEI